MALFIRCPFREHAIKILSNQLMPPTNGNVQSGAPSTVACGMNFCYFIKMMGFVDLADTAVVDVAGLALN